MSIWICSDWHANHDKPFIWEDRGFNNVDEMNKEIIRRHNELVLPEDEVYTLGDCCLGGDLDFGKNFIESLNGKIHIIRGNHCTDKKAEMYLTCKNVLDVSYGTTLKYKKYHFFLSHYPCLTSNFDSEEPLKMKTISLCGHSHTKDCFADIDKGLIFHCEMDTNDCRPWLLDDIIEKIKERV